MIKILRNSAVTLYLFSLFIDCLLSQTIHPDTLGSVQMNDTSKTRNIRWTSVIKSAIIPGLGQIDQENPTRALLFYGIGVSFLYKLVYNYYLYDRYSDKQYKELFYRYLGLYSQLYLVNLLDVIDTERKFPGKKWQGSMFSDKPLKSPMGAVVRSAILPGWGQIYNGKYLKAILCFAIVFDFSRKVYIYNQRYHDSMRRNKSLLERRIINSWYLGLCYMLTMVDAFVDAYLYKFENIVELAVHPNVVNKGVTLSVSLLF